MVLLFVPPQTHTHKQWLHQINRFHKKIDIQKRIDVSKLCEIKIFHMPESESLNQKTKNGDEHTCEVHINMEDLVICIWSHLLSYTFFVLHSTKDDLQG